MRAAIATFSLLLLSLGLFVRAADSTTSPSTQPSTSIPKLFQLLGDNDPQVREQARIDLMGLNRSDLESLRGVVQQTRFVSPQQAALLHDVVVHIFVTGQSFELDPQGRGCLGIQMGDTISTGDDDEPYGTGIIVRERFPGFCAFRMLSDGDILCGISEQPHNPFSNAQDLSTVIGKYRAGDRVHLIVRRGGRIVHVPITLDPRPLQFGSPATFTALKEALVNDAENFWDRTFAPLVEPSVSSIQP